jgi:hypothetical protein
LQPFHIQTKKCTAFREAGTATRGGRVQGKQAYVVCTEQSRPVCQLRDLGQLMRFERLACHGPVNARQVRYVLQKDCLPAPEVKPADAVYK